MFIPEAGHPFNTAANKVRNTISAAWTKLGEGPEDRAVTIVGVRWDGASGSYLQIRDKEDDVWYTITSDGETGAIDLFINPLTLYTPFDYYDSTGNSTLIVYGAYV